MKKFALLFLLVSFTTQAQTSREFRAEHTASIDLNYSVLSLPFPGSKGIGLNLNLSPDWQLALDYMSTGIEVNFSKLNLAGFNETLIGLKARRYYGNSFNLGFGYIYRTNEVYLDPNVYGISTTDVNARTEAATNMLHFSIANRWQFDHWSLGVDWLSLNIPIGGEVTQSVAKLADNESDREDIRTAEDVLTWYPNLATFTLSAGYMF